MKKALSLMITITLLNSCSSAKLTNEPIDYYLDNQIKNRESTIIVLDKKISNRKTLAIFKGDFMYNNKTNTYEREGKTSLLYSKENWDQMSKEYSTDSIVEYWKKNDFKLNEIVIVRSELLNNGELFKEYKNKELPVYAFSNPIFYRKKEFIVFTVMNSSTTFGAEPKEYVIIMKKNGDKWEIIDRIYKN